MKYFLKDNVGSIVAIVISLILLVFIIIGLVDAIKDICEYNEWYNNLPEDEQCIEREKYIERYEVVSVDSYIQPVTTLFGNVVGSDLCYTFQYIDNGKLITVNGFENLEYGLTKVIIGDSNMYIVDTFDVDTYRYLQLTEDTLQKCNVSNN